MTWLRLLICCVCLVGELHAATLVVANKSDASVSLFDLATGEEVARLAVGLGPHEVAVSADGTRAVISNYGTQEEPGNSLSVVDIPAGAVALTIQLGASQRPHGLQWLDEKRIAVTSESDRSLLVVDTARAAVELSVPTGQDVSHMLAVSPDGRRAYVANIGSSSVSVIDLDAGRKLADLSAARGTEGITLAKAGREVWVSNREAGTLTVFDARSGARLRDIESPGFPIRAVADDARARVYVTHAVSDELVIFGSDDYRALRRIAFELEPDPQRPTMFGKLAPGSSIPVGLLLAGDGSRLFVAHTNAHAISVYDPASWERTALLSAGPEPDGMGWSPLSVRR